MRKACVNTVENRRTGCGEEHILCTHARVSAYSMWVQTGHSHMFVQDFAATLPTAFFAQNTLISRVFSPLSTGPITRATI